MENLLASDEVTIEIKIAAMEQLRENLCGNPDSIPSPSWHDEFLSTREKRLKEGSAPVWFRKRLSLSSNQARRQYQRGA